MISSIIYVNCPTFLEGLWVTLASFDSSSSYIIAPSFLSSYFNSFSMLIHANFIFNSTTLRYLTFTSLLWLFPNVETILFNPSLYFFADYLFSLLPLPIFSMSFNTIWYSLSLILSVFSISWQELLYSVSYFICGSCSLTSRIMDFV